MVLVSIDSFSGCLPQVCVCAETVENILLSRHWQPEDGEDCVNDCLDDETLKDG